MQHYDHNPNVGDGLMVFDICFEIFPLNKHLLQQAFFKYLSLLNLISYTFHFVIDAGKVIGNFFCSSIIGN